MAVLSVSLPTQFATASYVPVFDSTAALAANIVSGETQVISANQGTDAQVIFPTYAPFYAAGLTVTFTPSGGSAQTLSLGTGYRLAYSFLSATRATGNAAYGGIVLVNNGVAGTVSIAYRTVGGTWVYRTDIQVSNAFATTYDPLVTAWEQFANYQQAFPVITTAWDKPDSTSVQSLILGIKSLCTTLTQQYMSEASQFASGIAHLFNLNNPHNATAANIGLGLVANYPPATDAQASDPTNTTTYITAAQLPLAFANITPAALDRVAGVVQLANPSVIADGASSTKTLTASAFVAYSATTQNALGKALNHSQLTGTFTGWPASWPASVSWRGTTYTSAAALIAALQTAVGVTNLEYNASTGKVWFPYTVTVPNMTLS